MAAAKTPIRMKGDTTCIHHKGRQLELYCEKCQELICTKCLSSVHKGHIICELSEIIPQKKQNIKNFIERTEKNDLVQIRKYITSTDTHFKDNDSTIEKLSHQLKMQTEKLKQDLDNLLAEKLSFYQKMKEDNDKLIQKYKQNMELFEEKLKQQMQDCKKVLQQGSYLQVYDTPCVINSPTSLPIKLILGTASFTPNTNPEGHLELAIGKITTSCQGQTSIDLDGSVSTSDRQEKLSSTQHGRKTDTKVMEEWVSPCYVGSICPNTDDQAWTSYYYSDTLTLLDRKGAAIQKVTNEAVINNISLSHITHRLWVCDAKNNILELVSGKLTHRFRTQEEPRCICVTASNHVIVGLVKHICKFTTQGQVVLTTMAVGTEKQLVCTPYRITECPVTHNVAVIDFCDESDSGDGNKCVVVMNTDFQELFVYRGDIPSTSELFSSLGSVYDIMRNLIITVRDMYTTYKQKGENSFKLSGVVYDSVGNLIIGDYNNNRVLLLSGGGNFLRIIHTDTHLTWAVGVDRKDVMWAVFGDSSADNVKLLQYNSV